MNALNQGFLLHRREYRETSYLADFFTVELGKVSAVVKGVRGSKSQRKGLLQPFQPLQISFAGRHQLKNVHQLEAEEAAVALRGKAMFCGLYLNEILNRTLADELPAPELYQTYVESLLRLSNCADDELEPLLRCFEFTLLSELGYGIDWLCDAETGNKIVADATYCFIREQGFQQLHFQQAGANSFAGEVILKVHQQLWDKQSLRCAKVVSRISMSALLGSKPLKSRELFLIEPT